MQGGEILIILLLALVVLGPKRLPEAARRIGALAAELRSAARDITRGLEAEVAQVKEAANDLVEPVRELKADLTKDLESIDPKGYQWRGPKPVSGPTPEDAMADLEEINRGGIPADEPGADLRETEEGEPPFENPVADVDETDRREPTPEDTG